MTEIELKQRRLEFFEKLKYLLVEYNADIYPVILDYAELKTCLEITTDVEKNGVEPGLKTRYLDEEIIDKAIDAIKYPHLEWGII